MSNYENYKTSRKTYISDKDTFVCISVDAELVVILTLLLPFNLSSEISCRYSNEVTNFKPVTMTPATGTGFKQAALFTD